MYQRVNNMKRKNKVITAMSVVLLCAVWVTSGLFGKCQDEDKHQYRRNMDREKNDISKDAKPDLIIAIDAGHGGMDPGKVGVDGQLEKDINLSIVFKLKEVLEAYEDMKIQVVMTRDEDMGHYSQSDTNKKMADMTARCKLIEEAQADMLVSIHQNSYHSPSVHGAQVFYYDKSEKGRTLAEIVQSSLVTNLSSDGKGRVAKANDNYYILLNVKCPAVIVECGFLSNREEARKLSEEEYQNRVAKAIAEGIIKYYQENY